MRFLSMIRVDETTGQKPSERLMQEMGTLMEEMIRDGSLVRTAGLRPTREGVRVRSNHGKVSITDGPFAETKEVIGGYALISAHSRAEAIELAPAFGELHRRTWPEFECACELRPIEGEASEPADSAVASGRASS